MNQEQATAIGQNALIWLAARPDALTAFLAAAGLAPEMIRARASEPEFLGFVLDFVLASDASVLAFATETGLSPLEPARARAVLGGGEPRWT